MKNILLVLVVFFLTSYTSLQAQQTINTEKSKINFHITGGGIFKVKGTFSGMQGEFNFNPNALDSAKFNICIDAASIDTNNKKRDAHLRDPDFFEVEKYPKICFESVSVSKSSDGFITKGNLSIRGITKEVEIPFSFNNNSFKGTITVNRFDYDLGTDFGTFRVGTEATVTIICVVE